MWRIIPLGGSGRYRARGWVGQPQWVALNPARNHVFLTRDISQLSPHTGERDNHYVEPITGSDVRLRHVSCEARAAPSLTRIISTLAKPLDG